VRHYQRFPPPPPRRARRPTHREFLHGVFVPTGYPFINHSVTVQCQKTRVSGPHESRGVFRPPFRHSHEGSPELIRFNALFPEPAIIKSFRTFDDGIGCDKGVDHFYKYHPGHPTLSRTPHIFLNKNMERAQKAYRNYKNANKAFREASAQLRKIGFMSELKYFPNISPRQVQNMTITYQKAHQNMINAYKRRNAAHAVLRNLASPRRRSPLKRAHSARF
jgi:hypothetical protein